MPIRKEFRKFYGKKWKEETRPRILERDGHKCKWCKAPDRTIVARWPRTCPGWWFEIDTGKAYNEAGELYPYSVRGSEAPEDCTFVKIVLTVAHLNHTPGDDDDENLAALCQRCHLKHDAPQHKETRAARKDAARPILRAIEEATQ
jgi:5-methylcytosine-specific restriction endonuclease McrA